MAEGGATEAGTVTEAGAASGDEPAVRRKKPRRRRRLSESTGTESTGTEPTAGDPGEARPSSSAPDRLSDPPVQRAPGVREDDTGDGS